MATVIDCAEQFYNECAVSPHQGDMQTVQLAPGVTLTRPGLVTPTMISPTFRERNHSMRGEHRTHTVPTCCTVDG